MSTEDLSKFLSETRDIVQSSNLNFMLGAGCSSPFLSILDDIEKKIDEASDDESRHKIYKKYFEQVMLPNKDVVNDSLKDKKEDYEAVSKNYRDFFKAISELVFKRKSTILGKQVNIFTTNIDILIEQALEKLGLEYNDGFSGHLLPVYDTSNYKKSFFKRSLHYENITEIPVFNLVKLHGSLNWKLLNKNIVYSKLEHFDKTLLEETDYEGFQNKYKEIMIVNPSEAKYLETILNTYYYDLLRIYSSELEKENTVLFVIGFSMKDEHIKQVTLRAIDSNPTLIVFVFAYNKEEFKRLEECFKSKQRRYDNLKILKPGNLNIKVNDLSFLTEEYFNKLLSIETENQEDEAINTNNDE